MYADENVIKIKHDVLYEVAKLAFAGELDEKRDNIAMSLIPGPTPQFRCCIYKEREIIRQVLPIGMLMKIMISIFIQEKTTTLIMRMDL